MNLDEQIRTFIMSKFPAAKKRQIGYEDSLLQSGIIDSLGVLEIVNYLVEIQGVDIEEDDLVPDNFESVLAISRLIEDKRGSSETAGKKLSSGSL